LRDHARILFVDHRRSLAQHWPSVRGSILGRLFEKARKEFNAQDEFKKKYEEAMDTLRTERIREIERTVGETAKRMLSFLGRRATSSIEIAFGFADPANPFNSLRLEYRESGLTVPGDELGLGIQSAMVVGIFEAFRQLGGGFETIVIEEPEMYLHPQAQRYFYRLLCEMADKDQCQVIYSTHSPIFADVNRFEMLRLMRRNEGKTTVSFVSKNDAKPLREARERFKLGNRFDTTRNEVVFASKALLTEGYGDRVAALLIAEKLGFDLDAEGGVVIDCGGKAGIELVLRVCRALGIPFVVLHDADIRQTDDISDPEKRKKQEQENEAEQGKNDRIKAAAGKSGRIYVITPSLEEALGIARDASDKPRRIVEVLNNLALDNAKPDLAPLIEAVKALCSTDDSAARAGSVTNKEGLTP
jgi:putative ATP-dependent endonuclease of OLD family